ncbi:hypothetical protein [Kribbella deserti]|uniref:Uncharacterized protein n=1 Tax=Kribbella deserti TaxID=1926257 RepID=A0ABV6QSM9_9ACTN
MRRARRFGAVGLVASLVVLAGCSSELKLDGKDVDEKAPFLQQLEGDWRNAVGKQEVSLGDGSHCWLARAKESKEFDRQAFCGPIRHLGAKDDGVFDVWSFEAQVGEDGKLTMTNAEPKSVGADFPDDREAWRPDGAQIPENPEALDPPQAPPVEKGFLELVDGLQLTEPKKPDPKVGHIVTPSVDLKVHEVAELPTLPGTGGVELRGPAEGEELRAITFTISAGPEGTDDPKTKTTYAVKVGTTRKPLELSGEDEPQPKQQTLVAGIPQGQDAQLVVTSAGLEQTLSLTTGERTSKNVPAYYRSASEVRLDKTYPLTKVVNGLFGLEHTVRFTTVQLKPYLGNGGWAKPGTVWLKFDFDDGSLRRTAPINYYQTATYDSAKSLTLTDDRGRKYPLAGALPTLREGGANKSWFAVGVADDVKSLTMTYAPVANFVADPFWIKQANPKSGTLNFKPMTVTFALPQ